MAEYRFTAWKQEPQLEPEIQTMRKNQPERIGYPALGAILALGILATGNASTDGIEKWGCGDLWDKCTNPASCPIILTADFGNGTGTINIDSTGIQETNFKMVGINRRWDWCLEDTSLFNFFTGRSFNCTFTIDPDETGLYFDFHGVPKEEKTSAKDVFSCTKIDG